MFQKKKMAHWNAYVDKALGERRVRAGAPGIADNRDSGHTLASPAGGRQNPLYLFCSVLFFSFNKLLFVNPWVILSPLFAYYFLLFPQCF